jgi:hypothetical protein
LEPLALFERRLQQQFAQSLVALGENLEQVASQLVA